MILNGTLFHLQHLRISSPKIKGAIKTRGVFSSCWGSTTASIGTGDVRTQPQVSQTQKRTFPRSAKLREWVFLPGEDRREASAHGEERKEELGGEECHQPFFSWM